MEEVLNAFKREHNGTDSTTTSDGYKDVCNQFPEISFTHMPLSVNFYYKPLLLLHLYDHAFFLMEVGRD